MALDQPSGVRDNEVEEALQRVCASAAFVRAPQLRRLLDYLVTCALAKKQNLKAYTIGVEALGRPHDFDPEKDAIVRVQATRLRHALDAYYEMQGQNDAVRIRLPAGSYAAVFELQETASSAHPPPARPRKLAPIFAGIAILLIAVTGLLTAIFGDGSIFGSGPAQLPGRQTIEPLHGNGLPTVVVRRFQLADASGRLVPSESGLRRFIAGAFSQFELVNTVYEPCAELVTGGLPREASIKIDDASRYDLILTAVPDGNHTHLQIQLIDRAADSIVWNGDFEVPNDLTIRATREKIARTLTATLLQPFGVVATRESGKHLRTNSGDPRYRCVLQAMDALRTASEPAYASAQSCLENAIQMDPGYSLAYYYLSSIYNRYYQYGLGTDPTGRPMLEKAMWAARRAIETNPTSARAHFALFLTYFNLRDFDAANGAIAKVRTLNEYDTVMLALYGGHLIALGKIDEGMTILDQIDAFDAPSCTQDFYGFIGHYLRGKLQEAVRRADQFTCLSYPYTFIAKALAAGATGDMDLAKQQVEVLRDLVPIWRRDPYEALKRMFPDTMIADRIMRDLTTIGLQATAAQQ